MKTYIVQVYDTVASYKIKAENKGQAETKAVKMYRKDKNTWLDPHSVEVIDESEAEET